MRSQVRRLGLVLVLLIAQIALAVPTVSAQGPNLIQNPGFERPYVPLPIKENCAVASPWVAWYIEGTKKETSQGYRLAPEYKAAFRADFPGNRVRNGELSQQWFHSYGNFQAGVLQLVPGVQVGATLRFELWGMTWSCDKEDSGKCDKATSGNPSPMHFRIGIDPYGGGDMLDPRVVWSPEQNAYDSWHHFQVDAVAKNSTITVMVYSYPDYRSQDNNVYVDDASLVVIAPPPAPTKPPTAVPTRTPMPTATPVPTNTPPATPTPAITSTPILPTAAPTYTPYPTYTPWPTCAPTEPARPAPTCPPLPTQVPLLNQLTSSEGLPFTLSGLLAILLALFSGIAIGRQKRRR